MIMLRIRELATAQGYQNANQFALECKLNHSLVRRYWEDTTSEYKKDALRQMARTLNVPVWALFEDAPDPSLPPKN